ncbi:MAG: hypothetical protein JWQ08_2152 [Deinococcus sp.]|nr:hypothetical protein [Deinococcus sp.]
MKIAARTLLLAALSGSTLWATAVAQASTQATSSPAPRSGLLLQGGYPGMLAVVPGGYLALSVPLTHSGAFGLEARGLIENHLLIPELTTLGAEAVLTYTLNNSDVDLYAGSGVGLTLLDPNHRRFSVALALGARGPWQAQAPWGWSAEINAHLFPVSAEGIPNLLPVPGTRLGLTYRF